MTWSTQSASDKGVGLTLNIPLRNRVAQATQIRAELEYRQAQMRLQQIENQVRIDVRNTQFAVQQNRASVQSAQAAVALAHQSLDAEQKKLALGASTSTLVLQNQSTLATAESTLVSAMAAYEKSRVDWIVPSDACWIQPGFRFPMPSVERSTTCLTFPMSPRARTCHTALHHLRRHNHRRTAATVAPDTVRGCSESPELILRIALFGPDPARFSLTILYR